MTVCPTRDQLRAQVRSTGADLRESSPASEAALVMTAGVWEGPQDEVAFLCDVHVTLGLFEHHNRGPVGS